LWGVDSFWFRFVIRWRWQALVKCWFSLSICLKIFRLWFNKLNCLASFMLSFFIEIFSIRDTWRSQDKGILKQEGWIKSPEMDRCVSLRDSPEKSKSNAWLFGSFDIIHVNITALLQPSHPLSRKRPTRQLFSGRQDDPNLWLKVIGWLEKATTANPYHGNKTKKIWRTGKDRHRFHQSPFSSSGTSRDSDSVQNDAERLRKEL
jgi:hypothetical protein